MEVITIVLAAGEGKRMNSDTPKVMHKIAGKELIDYVLEACNFGEDNKKVVVFGAKGDEIKSHLGSKVDTVVQSEQKGTGHAVMCAGEYLDGAKGHVLVLAGDMPLVTKKSIENLLDETKKSKAKAGLISVRTNDPTGYGRIVRNDDGTIIKIVEEKDTDDVEKKINEVNISIYCFEAQILNEALKNLKNDNAQGEYYITDCIDYISKKGEKIIGVEIEEEEGLGVNDFVQLEAADGFMRKRINKKHMLNGVRIMDSANTYIDSYVEIGRGTTIYPGNVILGKTRIGINNEIRPGNVIENSSIGNHCQIGPNAHLRPNSDVGDHCKIGNYVELKNVTVGNGSKVPHLSYCGDGSIGEKVNIGCGVIFTNFDGVNKFRTIVEDGAFIGCNSNLIAPVVIGKNSYIASGSTIVEDVPQNALGLARSKQINKENWALTNSPIAKSKLKSND